MSIPLRSDAKNLVGKSNLSKEPAVNTGAAVTAPLSAIALLISTVYPELLDNRAFTVGVTIAALFLPLITSVLIRFKVWSPASVQQVIEQATGEAIQTYRDLDALKKNKPVEGSPNL